MDGPGAEVSTRRTARIRQLQNLGFTPRGETIARAKQPQSGFAFSASLISVMRVVRVETSVRGACGPRPRPDRRLLSGPGLRQPERERRSLAGRADDVDVPAHGPREIAADRQTQT